MEEAGRHYTILNTLSKLPRKMLSLKGQENVTEFVLHELCHKNCFNLDKAAYFVDNPDFDCLKGMAGFAPLRRMGPRKISGIIHAHLVLICRERSLIKRYGPFLIRACAKIISLMKKSCIWLPIS